MVPKRARLSLHRRNIEKAEMIETELTRFRMKMFISQNRFLVSLKPGGAVVKHGGLWSR